MPSSLKRVSVAGALFCCLAGFGLLSAHATETACRQDRSDETVQVAYIHDGDTLWLKDGRKVRIIGINTPELARKEHPAEPLAELARDELRQLLGKSATIQLRQDKEETDHYGRLLAHVFMNKGINISEWLLRRGLAYAISIPPNLWQMDCYQRAEQNARSHNKGLWSGKVDRVLEANSLSDDIRGFQIIRGRIRNISHSRNTVWLNFNKQFAVRILRKDLTWFKEMDFEKLTGKPLEVRGWVQYHTRQLRMRIKHPAAIHILP